MERHSPTSTGPIGLLCFICINVEIQNINKLINKNLNKLITHFAWCLPMTPLQLAAQAPRDVAFAGHVARLRILLVLVHRRPAHPRRGNPLFCFGAHKTRFAIAVPSAQFADSATVGEQAGTHHCNEIWYRCSYFCKISQIV